VDRSVTVSLDGHEYEIHRARLGVYLQIQEAAERIDDASKGGDNRSISDALFAFLQISIPELTFEQFHASDWIQLIYAYSQIHGLNSFDIDFALMKFQDSNDKGLPVPWEYPERLRYFWIHMIASAYHWSREAIEHLWPEDAVAFIQEILAHQHYDREFQHSLSKVSYSYDQATKRSKYQPLQKPAWMIARDPKQLITRMPKALMPIGEVVYPEDEEAIH
jgi:hypothetical protein